ncbi:branched-chain amino acid ABC transporter permease [Rugamonas rubra]|jgi:branched-chain amino acid transport system permease protein|uniref:Branched-chain amino acid transport system permease protein n=1 Tax=Rugamonas rubra TaxID=758825 RepID=A0A1I4HRR9_9BURK|nr:branched-chain amino acid ABC transporter permease [Rugamonas rubra]PHV04171.1 branched-chain amino acid ABC transporter permease [Janthinobacterium sp. BJB412]SFL44473.1 branched-chain amino acid transport system permease protein [Rugamonas rubra]
MLAQFLQFLFSGMTVGAAYALAALGFTIIYNTSGVINFAQGEFIMLGGMLAAIMASAGVPLPLAIVVAVVLTGLVGLLMEKLVIEPAQNAQVVTLIIITIGASLVVRGLVQIWLGKATHSLPAFSGDTPIVIFGASLLPQSLWVLGVTLAIVGALGWFFGRTLLGKAMLATSHNKLAARLVGINTRRVLLFSFGLAALLGAVGGILVAPITYTSYDAGIMLGLKGFVAAVLGGLGGGLGAVAGGLILGIAEAMTAGYISSAYKDAVPFVLILLILFFLPRGLFGAKVSERV